MDDDVIPVHRLIVAARALIDSLSHDEQGTMIGGKYQGGNGGLISKQTITLADEVRRAINAMVGMSNLEHPRITEVSRLLAERDQWREAHDRVDHRAYALAQERDRLREECSVFMASNAGLTNEVLELRAERDRLREALESIVQWSEAYPLNIFQEPDLNEAYRLLVKGGITLDAVSASVSRHVVKGVGEIARNALAKAGQ